MNAALYLRISDDKRGEGAGVERQRKDCTALAKRKRATIVAEFDDNDRSATKGVRPAYERMLKRIAAGDIDTVIAYSQERLWRDDIEHPLFMRMARELGVRVVLVNGGEINPSDANDSMVSTIINAVAVMEAATTRRRVNRELQDRRAAGKYIGGGRAFGHNADRTEVVPAEAAALKDAVKRITAGESASSLVREWNANGITTTTGRPWLLTTFVTLLRQPRIAGLATVNGNRDDRRRQGIEPELVTAEWPAIVGVDAWRECVRVLGVRNQRRGRPTQAHTMSGGLMRCGKCNAPMYAKWEYRAGRKWPTYVCPPPTGNPQACGRLAIDGERAEAVVVDAVFEYIDTAEFARAVRKALKGQSNRKFADAVAALDKKRARLRDVETMFTEDEIGPAEYKRMRARLLPEVEKLERDVSEASGDEVRVPTHLAGKGAELRADWDAITVAERRDLLAMLVDRVVIAPVEYRGARWNPERVSVDLRY